MKKQESKGISINALLFGVPIRLPRISEGQLPKDVPSKILADCLWQGIKFMADEVQSLKDDDTSRAFFLINRCEFALKAHYHLLGYTDSEAENLTNDYLKSLRKECNNE